MKSSVETYRDRDYWIVENSQYAKASFRLRKCARLINGLAKNRACSLLDVGCGPAALRPLLSPNITYYGLDLATHENASYLRELDFSANGIAWDQKCFDFVVALGLFEYMGQQQVRKFEEIRNILTEDGKFIMSYVNFGHLRKKVWPNYNNVQSIEEMTRSLQKVFKIERRFPASHHWRPKQPGKNALPGMQMHINVNIPLISPLCALEYLFVCSQRR